MKKRRSVASINKSTSGNYFIVRHFTRDIYLFVAKLIKI